jgi:hypothetical protein
MKLLTAVVYVKYSPLGLLGIHSMPTLGHRENVNCFLPLLIKGKITNHTLPSLGLGDRNADRE